MPPRKRDSKIVKFAPHQRVWIYEAIDPETERAFYVGRTLDVLRRGAEHDRKSDTCKQLRALLQLKSYKFRDCVRVVPELPFGVPASRAAEFEAFFIIERKTLYDPSDPERALVCNLKHGDHVAELDYTAVEKEVAKGYKWPEMHEPEEPTPVMEARMREAIAEDLVDIAGDLDPDLCTALAVATTERKQAERRHMSPLAIAEELADEYEAKSKYEEVDRTLFESNLNSIRDRLKAEDVQDDKMLSLLNAIAIFGKSEGAAWTMRAHVAGNMLRGLAGAFETREEARLPDTTVVKNIIKVRNWVAENDGKRPSRHALKRKGILGSLGTSEEYSHGKFLDHWKGRQHNQADKPACDFIMRHVAWWSEFCIVGARAAKSAAIAANVNAMLLDGYGHKDEPDFEGKKHWPYGAKTSATHSVAEKMSHMTDGWCTVSSTEKMLVGLPHERAQWYRDRSSRLRPSRLLKNKASQDAGLARAYSNGAKKRKTDAGSSAAAAEPEDDVPEDEVPDDEYGLDEEPDSDDA